MMQTTLSVLHIKIDISTYTVNDQAFSKIEPVAGKEMNFCRLCLVYLTVVVVISIDGKQESYLQMTLNWVIIIPNPSKTHKISQNTYLETHCTW